MKKKSSSTFCMKKKPQKTSGLVLKRCLSYLVFRVNARTVSLSSNKKVGSERPGFCPFVVSRTNYTHSGSSLVFFLLLKNAFFVDVSTKATHTHTKKHPVGGGDECKPFRQGLIYFQTFDLRPAMRVLLEIIGVFFLKELNFPEC